jgi:hypothetical protein
MRYDNELGEQVFTFVIDGEDDVVVSVPHNLTSEQIVAMALQAMKPQTAPLGLLKMPDIGPKVDPSKLDPTHPAWPLAEGTMTGSRTPVIEHNDPRQIDLEDAISDAKAKEIEHKGEKYELAHDGAPTSLFF